MLIGKSLALIFLWISFLSFSQFGFIYTPTIPVKRGGNDLQLPWAGGLNYTQFSDFDYDFDGDNDLFLFDRSSNNIRVFVQESNNGVPYYQLAYNAHFKFPQDLKYRATLVDFNNDGKKDLFTYGLGGLKVYQNTGNASLGLQWELFKEIVYSEYQGGTSNLYISSSDIPAIIDVDNDGDIDILTFQLGGSHLEYHKNLSMENYGIPDSLEFVLKNECWGKFSEDIATNSILLNDPNPPCNGVGNVSNPEKETSNPVYQKHAGSTVLALDYDNNGVKDLIIGDIAYPNLNLLINGGTTVNSDSPMTSIDSSFPSNTTPVNIELFPASFFVDVDFDNIKDLIVCPNAKNVSVNKQSILFYKNYGTNNSPNFIFTQNDFLQSEMIEHGTGSIPIIHDLNNDGLNDLLVANFYIQENGGKQSTIAYYQNTGTTISPEFTFIDDDIFNFNNQNYGLRTIPTFGDIDNDGDDDMFIGKEDGTISFFENTNSSANSLPVFLSPVHNFQDNQGNTITADAFCFPQLFDLNNDGLLDLIIGKKSGELLYYENTGTITSPSFELKNNQLGNIDVSTDFPDGYPSPHFFRVQNKTHLFIGSFDGNLIYYDSIDNHLTQGDTFHLVSDNYLNIQVQRYSSFFIDDIDNDGNLHLFAGQDLGGIYHFEADPNNTSEIIENSQSSVTIFPNPAKDKIEILSDHQITSIHLINLQGKKIIQQKNTNSLNLSRLNKGIYFIQIYFDNGSTFIQKIILQ